jgi:hypothetical protein
VSETDEPQEGFTEVNAAMLIEAAYPFVRALLSSLYYGEDAEAWIKKYKRISPIRQHSGKEPR